MNALVALVVACGLVGAQAQPTGGVRGDVAGEEDDERWCRFFQPVNPEFFAGNFDGFTNIDISADPVEYEDFDAFATLTPLASEFFLFDVEVSSGDCPGPIFCSLGTLYCTYNEQQLKLGLKRKELPSASCVTNDFTADGETEFITNVDLTS